MGAARQDFSTGSLLKTSICIEFNSADQYASIPFGDEVVK